MTPEQAIDPRPLRDILSSAPDLLDTYTKAQQQNMADLVFIEDSVIGDRMREPLRTAYYLLPLLSRLNALTEIQRRRDHQLLYGLGEKPLTLRSDEENQARTRRNLVRHWNQTHGGNDDANQ